MLVLAFIRGLWTSTTPTSRTSANNIYPNKYLLFIHFACGILNKIFFYMVPCWSEPSRTPSKTKTTPTSKLNEKWIYNEYSFVIQNWTISQYELSITCWGPKGWGCRGWWECSRTLCQPREHIKTDSHSKVERNLQIKKLHIGCTTHNIELNTAVKKKNRVESWNSQGMFLGMVDDDCKRINWSLGQNGGAAGPKTCKNYPVVNKILL